MLRQDLSQMCAQITDRRRLRPDGNKVGDQTFFAGRVLSDERRPIRSVLLGRIVLSPSVGSWDPARGLRHGLEDRATMAVLADPRQETLQRTVASTPGRYAGVDRTAFEFS